MMNSSATQTKYWIALTKTWTVMDVWTWTKTWTAKKEREKSSAKDRSSAVGAATRGKGMDASTPVVAVHCGFCSF